MDSDYVFVNLWAEPKGQPLRYSAVADLVGRVRARTGIFFTPHMLRHTRATDLIRRGVSIEVASKLLTHRSVTTTSDAYIHLGVEDVRAELIGRGVWLESRLRRWQAEIEVRDEAGRPFRVTAHQFRHTLGTRMINLGVPEHVIQRLLDHASAEMTARYARLHDTTLRAAFDDYCQARVNITGEVLDFDADSPTADAEWVKHRLGRIQASLPNGFCGRPPQQDCPHPNACLTCPDFQTTPEFLPAHRQQADNTRILIATAEAKGQFRLVANHRRVLDSLEQIIPALEAIEEDPGAG